MDAAAAEVNRLLPVVGFLAAILVLARLCDDEGLFHAAGVAMARISAGRPQRLLAMVFVVASATTAILSLDATVVLLTPVVLATARSLAVPARPHAYATAHLANTASLLLPVSNLTNLLAFTRRGTVVPALRRGDGTAVACGHRSRIPAAALGFSRGTCRSQPQRKEVPEAAADAGVRAGRPRPDPCRVRRDVAVRAFPGVGRPCRRHRARRARTRPARHHDQPDRRGGRCAVPGLRAVPRGGGRRGHAARPRHRDA